jgi:prepilin-type processing-associated H-X9-DG protein
LRCTLDECVGKAEFAAQFGFADGHVAVIGLVVETGEVQKAVKEQDADLVAEAVTVGRRLTGGGFEGDGEIASDLLNVICGGKAQDVGGFIFAAEGFVEAAKGGIVGQKNVYFAGEPYSGARAVEEAR